MALSLKLLPFSTSITFILLPPPNSPNFFSALSPNSSSSPKILSDSSIHTLSNPNLFRISYRHRFSAVEDDDAAENCSFDEAAALFNSREYYKCHDVLEALWNKAEDPRRTLVHGILQCAVGFHHLFNQNHRGAMMELGEGVCKLRKMNFESGPFHQFEREISAVLDFIYGTQIELAACAEDLCLTMDQSERSYQLLGGYAAGQRLYSLQIDSNCTLHIVFCAQRSYGTTTEPPKVKLPILNATEQDLISCK